MNEPLKIKEKNIKLSVIEGMFASAMAGFTQEYFTPFLLLLGGTAQHVGLLNALPNLLGSLAQLKSADIVERLNSRKKMINIFMILQGVMLIPMAAISLIKDMPPAAFIISVMFYTGFGALASPAWGSFMSDLVDKDKRGVFFGWRNKILGFTTVGSMFVAGGLLYFMKKIDVYKGFALLFFLAFIWRFVSWYFLQKMHEPVLHKNNNNQFTFFQFVRRLKESNFAQFVVFVALLSFTVNIASPFFSVLMLRELGFNYFLFTLITLSSTFTIYCIITRWGRHADKAGNLKVIKITAPLIGCIPLLWIINRSPLFLICAQVFSGFVWAGFNLCTANFIYDAVIPEKRTRCIAYFNTINGTALCLGALMGGFLLPHLPCLFGYKILTLFLISSILRILVSLFLPLKLKEVRKVESLSGERIFFSMVGIRPVLGSERKTIRF
ncbi:MAG: MFS transporter [Candidatus Omnitrophica bacterium]|nr:MFS transporter [Candidatus Omnitrophota bacterium]